MTKTFADLELRPEILKAIDDVGYTTPTPIQAQAIPIVMRGSDVLGIAQTGTGKTAGFTLPMIHQLCRGRARARMPRSLILAPTRELAAQVAENFELYGKHTRLKHALLVGGVQMDQQVRKLTRGVDVLIATPGRLIDLFERGKILMSDVRILVIDECDRMLDMGFIPDIEKIVSLLPRMRQTLMFSATLPPEIRRLADEFLLHPQEIHVAPPASTSANVQAYLVQSAPREKRSTLRKLINQEQVKNAFIFCNRKVDVAELHQSLLRHGFDAGALHGDMTQHERTETLEKFKKDEVRLLVCSDVAARGLDVSAVSHVFNFDLPFNADDYVHRIGRTGRAGETGRAFSLATKKDQKFVDAIEELIGVKMELFTLDDDKPKKGRKKSAKKADDEVLDNAEDESAEDKPKKARKSRKSKADKSDKDSKPKKDSEDAAEAAEADAKAEEADAAKDDAAEEDDKPSRNRRRRPRRRSRKGKDEAQDAKNDSSKQDDKKPAEKKQDDKAEAKSKPDEKPAAKPQQSSARHQQDRQSSGRNSRGHDDRRNQQNQNYRGGRGRRPLSPADEVGEVEDTGLPGFGNDVPAFFQMDDD